MRITICLMLSLFVQSTMLAQDLEKAAEGLNKLKSTAPALPGELYRPQRIGKLLNFDDWVTAVCWIDEKTVVFGSFDEIRFYSADAKLIRKLPHDAGPVKSLLYDPSTKKLYAGCHQRILVIDPLEQKITATWRGHRGEVNDLALIPGRSQLVSVSNDQTVRFWDVTTGQPAHVIERLERPVYSVAISLDEKLFALGLGDEAVLTDPGLVQLWTVETREKLADLTPHKRQTTTVRFSPDGSRLLSGSVDERIHVYDVSTRNALGFFGGHSRPVNDLIILRDNDTIISASGGNYKKLYEVKLWRISEGDAFGSDEPHTDAVLAIAVSPDQKILATTSQDKTAALWSLEEMPGR